MERDKRSADEVRRELQAAYTRAGAAYKAKDSHALLEMVTPGFTQTMPNGDIIEYGIVEEALKAWFATPDRVTRYEVRIGEVAQDGERAILSVEEEIASEFPGPDGKSHERVQANTCRATWVRAGDGWRIHHSQYLTARMTVDGQPVQPMGT